MVVRGIVHELGAYRAYVEDTSANSILRLSAGDKLALGRVTGIDIDAIEYEQGGTKKSIEVGSDLTGKSSTPLDVLVGAEPTTGPVMPSGVEGLNPNDPNLTVEQRMKLRRAQELNRGGTSGAVGTTTAPAAGGAESTP
jgi:hypothetical protein